MSVRTAELLVRTERCPVPCEDRWGERWEREGREMGEREGRGTLVIHSTAQQTTAQHSTARCTAQHSTADHGTAQHSTADHSTAQHSTARHGARHLLVGQHGLIHRVPVHGCVLRGTEHHGGPTPKPTQRGSAVGAGEGAAVRYTGRKEE